MLLDDGIEVSERADSILALSGAAFYLRQISITIAWRETEQGVLCAVTSPSG